MVNIHLPSTQVLNSRTFTAPRHLLEDTEVSILDIYQWNEFHNANHPLFRFLDDGQLRTIYWKEAVKAIRNAACFFASAVKEDVSGRKSPPIVAVLATSDTITYFCTLVGIFWAGLTAFPISPRNGVEAVAELISRTGASCLYISSEPRIEDVATAALKTLQENGDIDEAFEIHNMPTFEDLFGTNTGIRKMDRLNTPVKRDLDAPLIILHSSGSTAHPKPISWSARRLKQWALLPWYGEIDFTGVVMACHAMPMFHGMGALQINTAASCGLIIATFKPAIPATFPTVVNVFQEAIATECDLISCVPSFVEEWATDPAKISHMKTLKGMIFGGGPLSQETGDRLASEGIALYQNYGCTEVGVMNTFLPSNPGMDWEYLDMSKQFRSEFVPRGDNTYELVVVADDVWRPAVINTKVDDKDAYATQDLFIPHESRPSLWKIFGRADDQIMLSTGEKTNPGPLESILAQDPHIQSGVIFGRGRFHNGVLIDPAKEHVFDPRHTDKLRLFRDAIWPTITRMNSFAPQHSRIFKEMILVASPDKPFTYTAKGTTRRQAILSDYTEEINTLYITAKQQASSDVPAPSSWDLAATLSYVRRLVHSVLNREVSDGVDIFQYGCDSLQAAWIRNGIIRALQTTGRDVASLAPNFVFQAASIMNLAQLVAETTGTPSSEPINRKTVDDHRIQELLDLVTRFTSDFPARPMALKQPTLSKDVVLLTGSTGGFGCHILAELVSDPSVEKIYALNRGTGARERQVESLRKQGLDPELVASPKVHILDGNMSDPFLGLDPSLYREIQESVTYIIHNAWKVDFNQSVKSFDKLLLGLRNLIDLALSSPHVLSPRVHFTSSIGVFRHGKIRGCVPEEVIADPEIVLGIGYTEAKWVGERLLEEARRQAGLRGTIVRLGQLCGAQNGYWNEREWFPTVVKSAEYLRCLPDVDDAGLISWIPNSEAAKALLEMRHSDELVLHLVHPRPVPWRSVIGPISSTLQVPLVPYADWLAKLEACLSAGSYPEAEDMHQYPALRLLEFFRGVINREDKEPLGMARLDVMKALRASPTLETIVPLSSEWSSKWLQSWRESGFLSTC